MADSTLLASFLLSSYSSFRLLSGELNLHWWWTRTALAKIQLEIAVATAGRDELFFSEGLNMVKRLWIRDSRGRGRDCGHSTFQWHLQEEPDWAARNVGLQLLLSSKALTPRISTPNFGILVNISSMSALCLRNLEHINLTKYLGESRLPSAQNWVGRQFVPPDSHVTNTRVW